MYFLISIHFPALRVWQLLVHVTSVFEIRCAYTLASLSHAKTNSHLYSPLQPIYLFSVHLLHFMDCMAREPVQTQGEHVNFINKGTRPNTSNI